MRTLITFSIQKTSINTALLLRIAEILQTDFFANFSNVLKGNEITQ
ncbi:MAG: hypothetical protein FWF65_03390 [Bacteroidetes bacterium]|nr:hypothetical protein [Bacteroidota bacterium]